MKGLDNWIVGGRGHKCTVQVQCPTCHDRWEVDGYMEYGMWDPDYNGDMICPVCDLKGLDAKAEVI